MDYQNDRLLSGEASSEGFADGTVLYRNEKTVVIRCVMPDNGERVVLKQAFGAEAIRRLRHEVGILERLACVAGVAKIAHVPALPNTLALRDNGGIPLSELLQKQRLAIPDMVELGRALAEVLAGVHRVGVIHKDINPSNVLVNGPGHTPTLIDFNISSNAAEERPGFTHQSHIVGTLRYMAPEQTGRTGRPVDLRVDLYSLGVLLYEVAVGHPPFVSDDLLELVHEHLVLVPAAPVEIRSEIPPTLSNIIMRLLEKEPDRRYQTADGLAQDLARLHAALLRGDTTIFPLAEYDFARRLSPPSRPIGRDAELRILQQSIDQAVNGKINCMLVAGAPGVGKSALISELRPMITAQRGWFVSTKFDQYRQDGPKSAVETMRALGRLLLSEPEEQLAVYRERIIKGLGSNLGLGPSLLPEFQLLLGEQPRIMIADPREAEARMIQATLDLLRSVTLLDRPVVMVFDDVQWAPSMTLRLFDAIITATEPIPGLLVVGAFRSNEVDAAHPLREHIARWEQLGIALPHIKLSNLPPSDISLLISSMLRLPLAEAQTLSIALSERTDGNPYDTVELINALRQDGLLVQRNSRWDWDVSAIHQYIGDAGVVDILGRRIAKLPPEARDVLEVMACLGGEVNLEMLAWASDVTAEELTLRLAPPLEDGLLVTESGDVPLLCFRHDRVQQAVFEHMDSARRSQQHLRLARRLVELPISGPAATAAAEQYLPAVDAIVDDAERRVAASLFHRAATRSRVVNYAVTERFLANAIKLLALIQTPADNQLLATLHLELHTVLYCLGQLDEGDVLYAMIAARCTNPIDLVEPAGMQMYSLINRSRHREAVSLGLNLLSDLGLHMPQNAQDRDHVIEVGLQRLVEWGRGEEKYRDFERPEASDPRVLAWAKLLGQIATAGFFCDPAVSSWATLEANRLWIEHGPCPQLMNGVCGISWELGGKPQDYYGAYVAMRHLIAVGEARHYHYGTALTRNHYAIAACQWGEPIENAIASLRLAREGLLQVGDVTYAGYTYLVVDLIVDCGTTLDAATTEVDAAMAFANRTRNSDFKQRYMPRLQLIRALQGETHTPGGFSDDNFDEDAFVQSLGNQHFTAAIYHSKRAISAAIFGDGVALEKHAAQAIELFPRLPGYYITAIVRVVHAMALGSKARAQPLEKRAPILEELDRTCLQWITARAIDSPINFLHLQRWVEAERTWASGQTWEAGIAFDIAMQEAALHPRPWHHALITERAGLFHLALGMEQSAHPLLTQACARYDAWGAAGKVREMQREHSFLRTNNNLRRAKEAHGSTIVSIEVIDMLAVLRASQALSSETSLARLTDRLGKVLGAMTGATTVQLLVRPDDRPGWFLAHSLSDEASAVSVEQAGERALLPLSIFRYVERTREVLLLEDAVRDDRFASDPYFSSMDQCSLLCAPILSHAELRAILILENPQRHAAFSAERMDAIMLIAGQMSVSLDNALLYASLERKVAERTAALEAANLRLEQVSRTDALTSLANRRCFNEALDAEWLRTKRTGTPLGLVIIDIDFFKFYNDHYGHQGGDACLQLVASVLATGRRGGSDLVARYGGEEFVILLPDTDLEGSRIVAERVRAAVEALQEPHVKSRLGIVTISLGVTAFVPGADSKAGQWVEQADAALYEAKRNGRNQVARSVAPSLEVLQRQAESRQIPHL